MTYGREAEITTLEGGVFGSARGSCQIVVGGYGVGKTHLCEVLSARFEKAGYAVARVEMGASHGRAENPSAVLDSICRTLSVQAEGMRFQGASTIACWLRATTPPRMKWFWESEFLDNLHERLPGQSRFIDRFERIRERYNGLYPGGELTPLLVGRVPEKMSASNLAVAQVNQLAHVLFKAGIKGVVLLLDEAERSNWAVTSYRVDRARDMMLGLALASANKGTGHLKHYGNDFQSTYCPLSPSRMHAIFWFTYTYGLADEIRRSTKTNYLFLEPLDHQSLKAIRRKVTEIYSSAYRWQSNGKSVGRIPDAAGGSETRGVIRTIVAALDTMRIYGLGQR